MSTLDEKEKAGTDFIRTRINQDNENGRFNARVHTRFPPDRTDICISDMRNPFV